MLFVYNHYNFLYFFSAGIVSRRQIMTSKNNPRAEKVRGMCTNIDYVTQCSAGLPWPAASFWCLSREYNSTCWTISPRTPQHIRFYSNVTSLTTREVDVVPLWTKLARSLMGMPSWKYAMRAQIHADVIADTFIPLSVCGPSEDSPCTDRILKRYNSRRPTT